MWVTGQGTASQGERGFSQLAMQSAPPVCVGGCSLLRCSGCTAAGGGPQNEWKTHKIKFMEAAVEALGEQAGLDSGRPSEK